MPTDALIRLGSLNDGGYVVARPAVEQSTLLISMGLRDDWSFESDFRRMSGARVLCFDHSVILRFWLKTVARYCLQGRPWLASRYLAFQSFFATSGIEHRRQRVGHDIADSISLASILADVADDAVFLKIDIEGAEYRVLDDIVAHAHRLTGIAMELHDIDLHRSRIDALLARLPGFRLVWIHANNCGGTDGRGDPLVIEVALVRHDLAGNPIFTSLDSAPNDPALPDVELRFSDAQKTAA